MLMGLGRRREGEGKMGVFFCGTPFIGYELPDRYQMLTTRGSEYGSEIEYYFLMEVFDRGSSDVHH
jgi:dual oxidase